MDKTGVNSASVQGYDIKIPWGKWFTPKLNKADSDWNLVETIWFIQTLELLLSFPALFKFDINTRDSLKGKCWAEIQKLQG